MDPLSDVLALLKPNIYGFRGLEAGGDWALAYGASAGIHCYVVTHGGCWLTVDGAAGNVWLGAGDIVLLPRTAAFRLASSPDVQPVDALTVLLAVPPGDTAVINDGRGCAGVGGFFGFAGMHAERLLGTLPHIVHFRDDADKAALRWFIDRLMRELRDPQPGSSLIAEHMAQTFLIVALRTYLADRSATKRGWLFALGDRQIHAVIAAMHGDPARKWTLATLARIAGMSRSNFAARFKETVGESAMTYLTRWRMMVAADLLANPASSIAVIAPAVGYVSESAFGAAFKRVIGHSPRRTAPMLACRHTPGSSSTCHLER
jgi:AraC-like DNA-binding protein